MAKILPCGCPVRPSPWVMRWRHLIDPSGEVLDLACGEGRHTAMLLLEGRRVLACDINLSGMTALKDHPLLTLEARDLEGDPWPWGSERFAGIIVTNYLHRAHFPHYWESLAPDGIFITETFNRANGLIWGHPRNPDHFLESGELLRLMPACARLIAFEEGLTPEGWSVERLVFAKPGSRAPLAYPFEADAGTKPFSEPSASSTLGVLADASSRFSSR